MSHTTRVTWNAGGVVGLGDPVRPCGLALPLLKGPSDPGEPESSHTCSACRTWGRGTASWAQISLGSSSFWRVAYLWGSRSLPGGGMGWVSTAGPGPQGGLGPTPPTVLAQKLIGLFAVEVPTQPTHPAHVPLLHQDLEESGTAVRGREGHRAPQAPGPLAQPLRLFSPAPGPGDPSQAGRGPGTARPSSRHLSCSLGCPPFQVRTQPPQSPRPVPEGRSPPLPCPHHEVGARSPHDHQLQLQLLGHQLHTLAEGYDLEAVAGVGQADNPVGREQSAAAPSGPRRPARSHGLPHVLDGDDCLLHGDHGDPQLHDDPGDVPAGLSPQLDTEGG